MCLTIRVCVIHSDRRWAITSKNQSGKETDNKKVLRDKIFPEIGKVGYTWETEGNENLLLFPTNPFENLIH